MVLFNRERAVELALTLLKQFEALQAKAKQDEALQEKAKQDEAEALAEAGAEAAAGVQKRQGVAFAGQCLYEWLKLEARKAMRLAHDHASSTTPDLDAKAVTAFYLDTTTALLLEWAFACLRTKSHIKASEKLGDLKALDAMERVVSAEKCRLKNKLETRIVDFITNIMFLNQRVHFPVDALRERAIDVNDYLLDAYYNKLPDEFVDEPNYLLSMETLANQGCALVHELLRKREEALTAAEEKEPDTEEKEPAAESPTRKRHKA